MAEVTLPQFPEPRIRPNLSRPTHRVPKLRDVSAVFQFIHSRSFDASGQNPVSRIAGWGPQGAPSFQRGKIPDSKFQVLSVDQGPEYRFSSEPSGRGGWTRIQIPSSRGGLSHIFKSEKTQVEEFPQGGSRIQREGNERAKYKIHMIAVSRWRVGTYITRRPAECRMPSESTLYSLCLTAKCASHAGRATMPATTCSQRPTTTPTSRRPAVRVARTRSPLGLARRHGAKGPVTRPTTIT